MKLKLTINILGTLCKSSTLWRRPWCLKKNKTKSIRKSNWPSTITDETRRTLQVLKDTITDNPGKMRSTGSHTQKIRSDCKLLMEDFADCPNIYNQSELFSAHTDYRPLNKDYQLQVFSFSNHNWGKELQASLWLFQTATSVCNFTVEEKKRAASENALQVFCTFNNPMSHKQLKKMPPEFNKQMLATQTIWSYLIICCTQRWIKLTRERDHSIEYVVYNVSCKGWG